MFSSCTSIITTTTFASYFLWRLDNIQAPLILACSTNRSKQELLYIIHPNSAQRKHMFMQVHSWPYQHTLNHRHIENLIKKNIFNTNVMHHIQQKINIFKRLWITFYHLDEAHVFVPFQMKCLTTSRLSTSCGLLQMET